MKPQIRLIIPLFFFSLLIFGCTSNDFGNITNAGDSTPQATPTFRIRIWGDPPDTITPRSVAEQNAANSTSLPPTETIISPTETPLPTNTPEPSLTKILFTGSIVPGRCVQAAVDEKGQADFLYDDVRELVSSADIAVGTLNAALSDYPPHTGCIQTFVLVGSANNADAMSNAGFAVMSVATNHIKNCGLSNCGDRAFYDTMDNLRRVGILPVGAGNNLQEAMQPIVVERNGIRFGFVSLGEIESMAFASANTPGIAPLPEDFDDAEANLRAAIAAAREVSDVVITMPHWGSDYGEAPNYRQLFFDQVAVDAGADLVIGNHPHVIQGMREIKGIPVFYSLGSFVFDQDWSVETQQGIVVVITFQGTELLDYEVIPVRIDANGHVQVAASPEAEEILGRFERLSEELR